MKTWRIAVVLMGLMIVSGPASAQDTVRRASAQPESKALNLLHISFVTLEAVDVYTTVRGVNAGAVEANPLMRSTASNPVGLTAMKAGVAASSILLTRRMARDHRVAAIVLAAAVNSAYAAVAVHNIRATRR